MKELLPTEKGKPGRVRTVTARAWISRPGRRALWKSHVYAGKRRVHILSTGTTQREKALAFNRCHLLQILNARPGTTTEEIQLHLPATHG